MINKAEDFSESDGKPFKTESEEGVMNYDAGGDSSIEPLANVDTNDQVAHSVAATVFKIGGHNNNMEGKDKVATSDHQLLDPKFSQHHLVGSDNSTGAISRYTKSGGHGFEMGDMVWGKVKSHPWWPGFIFNEGFASSSVMRTKKDDHVLVAFFGDSSYGWFDPAELLPYESHFFEKSKQSTSRTFVKAVEESADEVYKRSALGLTCCCRNPYNFRPTSVPGYSVVDIFDYGSGAPYSTEQIEKARQSLRLENALSFMKKLAVVRNTGEMDSLDFGKQKAVALAYRSATYEEFDETYAEAFGEKPVRPAVLPLSDGDCSARALLSGPMVIAESISGRKSSKKSTKSKEHLKDKYVLKRREESSETRSAQTSQGQPSEPSSVVHSVSTDGLSDSIPADGGSQRRELSDDVVTLVHGSEKGDSELDQEAVVHVVDSTELSKETYEDTSSTRESNIRSPVKPKKPKKVMVEGSDKEGPSKHSPKGPDVLKSGSGQKKKKKQKGLSHDAASSDRPLKRKQLMPGHGGGESGCRPLQISVPSETESRSENVTDLGPALTSAEKNDGGNLLVEQLSELRTLALDPSHGKERNVPAQAKQLFLRFRSHVFRKSLTSVSPPSSSELELFEDRPTGVPSMRAASSSHLLSESESSRNYPTPLRQNTKKTMGRSDESSSKGGKKRIPSERPDETAAAKRPKKITAAKRAGFEMGKSPEVQRGPDLKSSKGVVARAPARMGGSGSRVAEPPKVPPRRMVEEPTLLVMKYPHGRMPSPAELKARWARFGPMDMSQMRVYYNTDNCRVCFLYREDAERALRYAQGNSSSFPNVRFSLRPGVVPDQPLPQAQPDLPRRGGSAKDREDELLESRPQVRVPAVPSSSQVQLKSCLKKPGTVEDMTGGNGRGAARVRFNMSGGVESNGPPSVGSGGGGQLAKSSACISSVHTDVLSDNEQQKTFTSSLHPLLPSPPAFSLHLSTSGVAPPVEPVAAATVSRNNMHNYNHAATSNAAVALTAFPQYNHQVDISQQMLRLLTRCNDVVANVKSVFGYVPYHPL